MVLTQWEMLSGKEPRDDVGVQQIDHAVFAMLQIRPSGDLKLNEVTRDEDQLELSRKQTNRVNVSLLYTLFKVHG